MVTGIKGIIYIDIDYDYVHDFVHKPILMYIVVRLLDEHFIKS